MLTLTNKNDEDSLMDVKENNYYWCFLKETFILIHVETIKEKEISYRESQIILDDKNKIQIKDSLEERKMNIKDKANLQRFDISQLNPFSEDLATITNISYPSILYNLKLKNAAGIHFTKAGKLLIGINYHKKKENSNDDSIYFLNNFLMNNPNNQTVIINGLPNTGKTKLMKSILDNIITSSKESTYNSCNTLNIVNNLNISLFLHDALDLIEIFGNAIENENNLNSSRYMRVLKLAKMRNSNKLVEIKIKHYLFEKSRILEKFSSLENPKMNFHIFHSLMEGLKTIFLKELYNSHEEFNDVIKIIKSEYNSYYEKGIFEFLYKEYNNSAKFEKKFNEFYLDKFYSLLKLLKRFNFSHKKIIKKIFNILLTILLMLKIEFDEDEEGKATLDENNNFIQIVSILLDCDSKLLSTKLISREIKSPRGSFYVIRFTKDEALRTRDTFLKYLYDNLFEYLTRYINVQINREIRKESLGMPNTTSESDEEYYKLLEKVKKENLIKFTTIVECFGFENSEDPSKNSLENLCINYTNDKLNNLLFEILIKGETELYKEEGIIQNESDFFGNKKKIASENLPKETTTTTNTRRSVTSAQRPPTRSSVVKINTNKNYGVVDADIQNTLQACEDNSKGIFKLIDVQGSLININKGVIKALFDNIKLSWPQINTTNNSFFLTHFGSVVEYGASDFVLKNIDTVYDDLKDISKKYFKHFTKYVISTHSFFKDKVAPYLLKPTYRDENMTLTGKEGQGRSSMTRRISQNLKLKSNTEKFLNHLKNLLNKITQTNVSFVKLINTSTSIKLKDISFDDKFILQQIYSSGIFESILLAKGGYFIRHNYEELFQRLAKFKFFFDDITIDNKQDFIQKFSKAIGIDSSEVMIGKSFLFIKNHALNENKQLMNCNDLPSFLIFSLLQKLLKKFLSVFRLFKYFSSVGKKGRLKFLISIMQEIFDHCKLKYFVSELKYNYEVANTNSILIQKNLRKYLNKKKTFSFVNKVESKIYKLSMKEFVWNIRCIANNKMTSACKIQNVFNLFKTKKKIHKLKTNEKLINITQTALKQFYNKKFFCNLSDLVETKIRNADKIKNYLKIHMTRKRVNKLKVASKLFNLLSKNIFSAYAIQFLNTLDNISQMKIRSANLIKNNLIIFKAKKNLDEKRKVKYFIEELHKILFSVHAKQFLNLLDNISRMKIKSVNMIKNNIILFKAKKDLNEKRKVNKFVNYFNNLFFTKFATQLLNTLDNISNKKIQSANIIKNNLILYKANKNINDKRKVKSFNEELQKVFFSVYTKHFLNLLDIISKTKVMSANIIKNNLMIYKARKNLKEKRNVKSFIEELQKVFFSTYAKHFLNLLDIISKTKVMSANIIKNNLILYKANKNLKEKRRVKSLIDKLDKIIHTNYSNRFLNLLDNISTTKVISANIIKNNLIIYKAKKNIKEKRKMNNLLNLLQKVYITKNSKQFVNTLENISRMKITSANIIKNNVMIYKAQKNLKEKRNVKSFIDKLQNIINANYSKHFLNLLDNISKMKILSANIIKKNIVLNRAKKNLKEKIKVKCFINSLQNLLFRIYVKRFLNLLDNISNKKIQSANIIKNNLILYKAKKNINDKRKVKSFNEELQKVFFSVYTKHFLNLLDNISKTKVMSANIIKNNLMIYKARKNLKEKRNVKSFIEELQKVFFSTYAKHFLNLLDIISKTKVMSANIIKNNLMIYKARKSLKEKKNVKSFIEELDKIIHTNYSNRFFNLLDNISKTKVKSANIIKNNLILYKAKKILKEKRKVTSFIEELDKRLTENKLKQFFYILNNINDKYNSIDNILTTINRMTNQAKLKQFYKLLELNKTFKNVKATIIQNCFRKYRIKNGFNKIDEIVIKHIKREFISNFKSYLESKNESMIKIQNIYRKFSIKKRLQIKRNLENFIKNVTNVLSKINKQQGLCELKNSYKSLQNKICSVNLIKKKFNEYKLLKQKKLDSFEKALEMSKALKNILDRHEIKSRFAAIKLFSNKKICSVINIQKIYMKFKVNKNKKTERFVTTIQKLYNNNSAKLFLYNLYSKQKVNSLENLLKEKFNQVNEYHQNNLIAKLKLNKIIKNNLANKINKLFKKISFNKKLTQIFDSNIKENKTFAFKEIKINSLLKSTSANKIIKSLKKYHQKVLNEIEQDKLIANELLREFFVTSCSKTFFREFKYSFETFLALQQYIKQFVNKIQTQKKESRELFRNLALEYEVRTLIREIKDSAIFSSSLKLNLERLEKSDEMFTLNYSGMEIIDNYVEDKITEYTEEKLTKTSDTNLLGLRSEEVATQKSSEKKVIHKSNKSSNAIPSSQKPKLPINKINKPTVQVPIPAFKLNKKENPYKSNSTTKKVQLKSMSLEIETKKKFLEKKKTITKMKSINKNLQNEFSKNKHFDKMIDDCSKELDSLIKDISLDMQKINNEHLGPDYKMLNKEKKKISSKENMINENECYHAHTHEHESINISGNYENVSFKRVCLCCEQLKKI